MKTPDELTGLFRARGLKVTPQRQSIFRALHETEEHPTAEYVYEEVRREMPTIALRTVYQTLNDLTAMGELHQITLGSGSARFDPTIAPHHHLVCESCGQVSDLHLDFPEVRVPDDAGFIASSTEIVFRGRCGACRDASVPAVDQSQQQHNHKEHAAHG